MTKLNAIDKGTAVPYVSHDLFPEEDGAGLYHCAGALEGMPEGPDGHCTKRVIHLRRTAP